MRAFNPAKPDKFQSFSSTQYDNLSDEELRALINSTGRIKVAPQQHIPAKKHIDLDKLTGGK